MCLPHRTFIEGRQHAFALDYSGKTAHPDKAIGVFQVAEWTENRHADRFLWLDELVFEERDESRSCTSVQGVLSQFHDGTISHRCTSLSEGLAFECSEAGQDAGGFQDFASRP